MRPKFHLHIDIVAHILFKYLVIVNSYSQFTFVEKLTKKKRSRDKKIFGIHGIANIITSDNEPSLVSENINKLCKENKILLVTSSPYHSVSNKLAETEVKNLTKLLIYENCCYI